MIWYPLPDPGEAAGQVAQRFREAFGRAPDGVWAAPGRVNLIGEHVDYNAGLCLPFALPHRTFVAMAARDDTAVRVRSAQRPDGGWQGDLGGIGPGTVRGWAAYAAGVPWALRAQGLPVCGFDAVVDGFVPVGSGLSSSAALECAVATALDELAGLGLGGDDAGRARLAAACVRAENEIAAAPTGGMDQAAALRSSPGHALLLDCRDFTAELLPLDLPAAGLRLLVIDTRAAHTLVDGRYGSRRRACEDAAAVIGVAALRDVHPDDLPVALQRISDAAPDLAHAGELRRRARHVVTEIDRVRQAAGLLRAGRAAGLGPLLDASHASLRGDFEVSCPELDVACETAVAAGALGARMTGGGFGGSAIALLPDGGAAGPREVAGSVADAFAARGFAAPAFLDAVAAGPASRIA